ncbi:hypothetical protein RB151_008380 [Providencia rettgeri]|nr:hypothetical protein RB151_008380 [Providencia rettgeri]AVL74160.1 hypothetical protein CEQ08_10625 [Providencia rettgeri]
MKFFKYFILLSVAFSFMVFFILLIIKTLVELIYYYSMENSLFSITKENIIDYMCLGIGFGFFFSIVACLVSYFEYKRR